VKLDDQKNSRGSDPSILTEDQMGNDISQKNSFSNLTSQLDEQKRSLLNLLNNGSKDSFNFNFAPDLLKYVNTLIVKNSEMNGNKNIIISFRSPKTKFEHVSVAANGIGYDEFLANCTEQKQCFIQKLS
jgi:hypothetical protein